MAGKSRIARQSTVYIDKGIVVLNKPPGLITQLHAHRRQNSQIRNTIGNLGYDFNQLLDGLRKTFSLKELPYPVHRLDKGTTGALTVACSAPIARELSRQLQQRTMEKTYLALVRGGGKSFPSSSGAINAPIQYTDGRAALDPSQDGKPSITEWEVIDSSSTAPLSLLRFKLHTGHKHQLRVHAAHHLNAPILGDTLYSRTLPLGVMRQLAGLADGRLFLHASKVSILVRRYKSSGPKKCFRLGICAPLPEDFLKVCMASGIQVPQQEMIGGVTIDGAYIGHGQVPELNGYWVSTAEA